MSEQQITAIVRHRVKVNHTEDYREASKNLILKSKKFSGYLGTRVIEPNDAKSPWIIVFSFNNHTNFSVWINSKERAEGIEQLTPFIEEAPDHEVITGINYWMENEKKNRSWPPSQKMTVVAFFSIFPLSYFIPPLIKPYFIDQPLLGSIIAIAVVTVIMSNISLPIMVRLFKRWIN